MPFFGNWKIVAWFYKESALILKTSAMSVCIYGLNSHLKGIFKSILDKKATKFSPVGSFFCMWYMKRLTKYPYSKKPTLPKKILGCVPVVTAIIFWFPFLELIQRVACLPVKFWLEILVLMLFEVDHGNQFFYSLLGIYFLWKH